MTMCQSIPTPAQLLRFTAEERFEQEVRMVLSLFFPDSHAALSYFQTCEARAGADAIKPLRDAVRIRWVARQAVLKAQQNNRPPVVR